MKRLPLRLMKVYYSIESFPKNISPILTLGMYDGVHIGHQSIINQLNKKGKQSTLLTFDPHPRQVLQKADDLQFLTLLDEKINQLEVSGLQNLIVHPFTFEFAQLTSYEFVKNVLVDLLSIDSLMVGYNHQFGKNRSGNFEQLLELSKQFGFDLQEISEVKSKGKKVSSTQIRKALWQGDVNFANKALGRPYSFTGKVVRGDGLGTGFGFPTANLVLDPWKLIPKNGVYAVKVNFEKEEYIGMLNIGTRPTITNSNEKRIEVNIFDFDQNIYNKPLTIELISFLRDDIKFPSIESLITQIKADKQEVKQIFST